MATDLGTSSVTLSQQRRTWRINIESAIGTIPVLTAHRELVSKVGDTVIAKDPSGNVTRSLAAVAAESITLHDGMVITPAHIAEALVALIERWEAADLAPPPAPVE